MKRVLAVLLLSAVVEGELWWGNMYNERWRGPFQPPGQSFQPPGHVHPPPGHVYPPPGQVHPPPGQVHPPPGHVHPPPGHVHPPPPGQSFQPHGPPFPLPGLGLGRHGQQNWHPQQQQEELIKISKAEWICQNPKTRDMMIIAAIDGAQTVINGQPLPHGAWPNQYGIPNSNGNSHNANSNKNSSNANSNNENVNNIKPGTSTPQTNSDEPSRQHGGEGLIDIRLGAN